MNILHHKSWHVRTRKNIEKVRQDEKKALEEQTEKARKADIAEQERRIQELRGRFKTNRSEQRSNDNQTNKKDGHINFFQTDYDQRGNKAHELEQKLEKDQWEKKVGIVQYLGGNQSNDRPWYEKLPSKLENEASFKDASILERHDPLNHIKKELNRRKQEEFDLKKSLETRKRFERKLQNKKHDKRYPPQSESLSRQSSRSNGRRTSEQLDERKSEQTNERSNEIDTSQMSEKELKLKLLRDKRLKREKNESERSRNLFSDRSLFGHCVDERQRAYSNQFNPHLSRK